MIQVIIFFGVLVFVAGILLLVRPSLIIGFLESKGDRVWVYSAAVFTRVVLGLFLVGQAVNSKFPLIIEILGWVSLAAGLFLGLLGRDRFTRFMRWIIEKVKPFAPLGGLFAALFGGFLVYAFV